MWPSRVEQRSSSAPVAATVSSIGLVVLLLAPLLPPAAAASWPLGATSGAASDAAPLTRGRGLKQYPYTYEAYDRTSMAGKAKGQKAGGHPESVGGPLATPDKPALSDQSASMEGGVRGRRE
jgi:hypothetical protein